MCKVPKQPIFLASLFGQFEPLIREAYRRAAVDAQVDAGAVPLRLEELSWEKGLHESEFVALGIDPKTKDPAHVRITWNGIASLWALAHAIARVARVMFEAQRNFDANKEEVKLPFADHPEAGMGVDLFELSLRLAKHHFDRWVDWAPQPTINAVSNDDQHGNTIFLRALGWIMRHELAHIVLKHHDEKGKLREDHFRRERAADATATLWMKGQRSADPNRQAGDRPSDEELVLENAAVGIFSGLVWISQFECVPHPDNYTHPDAADRLRRVIKLLDLAQDSGALEIFSYAVKAMIDPAGNWPVDPKNATALDAALDAWIRLNRRIHEKLYLRAK